MNKMWIKSLLKNRQGMEMVQVAILVAIAIVLGLIFKTEITEFVNTPQILTTAAENAKKLGKPDAVRLFAAAVLKTAGGS